MTEWLIDEKWVLSSGHEYLVKLLELNGRGGVSCKCNVSPLIPNVSSILQGNVNFPNFGIF